jgi:hypothetical protein
MTGNVEIMEALRQELEQSRVRSTVHVKRFWRGLDPEAGTRGGGGGAVGDNHPPIISESFWMLVV